MSKNNKVISIILFLIFSISFIFMAVVLLGDWLPASKWWIIIMAYLSGTGFLYLNYRSKNFCAILTFSVIFILLSFILGFHNSFPLHPLKDNTLQTLAEAYPAPQTDMYILYSYIDQHFQDPVVYISANINKHISEEVMYSIGGASQVIFVDDVNQFGCQLNKENMEFVDGFFSLDYAFIRSIHKQEPTLCIWQESNILYVNSK